MLRLIDAPACVWNSSRVRFQTRSRSAYTCMVRFIPKETKFFEMFAEVSKNLTDAARLLQRMLSNHNEIPTAVERFRELEHRGDDMTHAIITKLNQTFITPFDREDIHRLASSLDDVLDFMNSAAVRLVMYKITTIPTPAAELAQIVVKQCEQ